MMIKNINIVNGDKLTAIVACPSVGNVGQLATDLLISNLNAEYVGMAWHPGVLPLAGGDPYRNSSDKMCSSSDFYLAKAQDVIFVQLRAPVLAKEAAGFCEELVALLVGLNVKKVVVLSGMFGHQRDDTEMRAGMFRYVLNALAESDDSTLSQGWPRLPGNEPASGSIIPKMRGAGFTRYLLNSCTQKSLPAVALLYFCSEGDNLQDSLNFTSKINEWLNVLPNPSKIDTPLSWKYLFGSERPKHIY